MLSGTAKRLAPLALIVLLLTFARTLRPQTADLQRDRVPMAEVTEPWRFHVGDDPRWSEPKFDDSTWPLLKPNEPWSVQGYSNYAGFGWYRFNVLVPPDARQYGLYIPSFPDSVEVFVNGRLIAHFGRMPPQQQVYVIPPTVIPLPPARPGEPLVIAIRAWQWLYGAPVRDLPAPGAGLTPLPRVGELATLRQWAGLQRKQIFWNYAANGLVIMVLLIGGVVGLALFALRSGEREYLWFGLYELFQAAYLLGFTLYISDSFLGWRQGQEILWGLLSLASATAFLFFLEHLLGLRRSPFIGLALASAIVTATVFQIGELVWILTPGIMPWKAVAFWNGAQVFTILPYWVCVLILLWRAARRGVPDAQLLLFPIGLEAVVSDLTLTLWVMSTLGLYRFTSHFRWFQTLGTWPIPFGVANISDLLVQTSLLAILVLRFARTRSEEEHLKSELEAARAVQQVLIPEKIPAIPGFHIDCVYKPAGQVGGDFFLILPVSADSALVVIGDVSGKGMPAAMTVSLLVGALHSAARTTTSPTAILAILNRCALTHSIGGFATCLILRINPNGHVIVANAGHLTPYIDGSELELQNGLPLGIDGDSSYPESIVLLEPNQQLTLITDGVVEARNKAGELYGFERAASIASASAESIAQAAQDFGQQDDITVLTLSLSKVPEASRKPIQRPAVEHSSDLTQTA
jgi:hypothetical protein